MSCGVDGNRAATIVVVQESAAVLELIEQALRARGDRVLTTSNPLEALEVIRRVHVDLLILGAADRDTAHGVARDLRTIQSELRVIYIGPKPVSLSELTEAVAAELAKPR